jgi:Flp pilus assembly protein TadD
MPSDLENAAAGRHVRLGRMLVRSRRWEKAEEQARAALARSPRYAPAHALLGDALAGRGDCPAAREAYDRALALDPSNAAAEDWRKACAR